MLATRPTGRFSGRPPKETNMGDIGEERETIEILPTREPVRTPSREPVQVPADPTPSPKEPVPA